MNSAPPSDDPDSRTSSVGRKRVFNQLATDDSDVFTVEDDLSAEELEHSEKRARHGSESQKENLSPVTESTKEDTSNVERTQGILVSLHDKPGALPSEHPLPDGNGKEVLGSSIQPLISWNKSAPGAIRTSFGSRSSLQFQLMPSPLTLDHNSSKYPTVKVARLDAHAGQEYREEDTDGERSEFSEAEDSLASLSQGKPQQASKKRETPYRSSFGGGNKIKSQALSLISSLPENQKDLMPREISGATAFFRSKEYQFKLPTENHPNKAMWALQNITFRDKDYGFIDRFCYVNVSLLEHINFDLVVSAFAEYLEQFYGHLPVELRDMVLKNRRFVGDSSRRRFPGRMAAVERQSRRRQQGSISKTIVSDGKDITSEHSRHSSRGQRRSDEKEVGNASGAKVDSLRTFKSVETADKQMPNVSASVKDWIDIDKAELELLKRYYPGNKEDALPLRCLTCAQTDHKTSDCPSLSCATCGLKRVHFTNACPQTSRCRKCRGIGHQKSECPEKLVATSSDGLLICAFCQSSEHVEEACHYIWRTFKPDELKSIRIVADIPKECYSCGASGHYGPECGLRQNPLLTGGYTWSTSNWNHYVDPNSKNLALFAVKDYSLPTPIKPRTTYSIRGRAQRDYPVLNDDDDDDGVQFMGERVRRAPRPTPMGKRHIKFASAHPPVDIYDPTMHHGPPLPPRDTLPPLLLDRRRDGRLDSASFNYRPLNDSARYRRERSFSPPPPFPDNLYDPQPGGNTYREPRENNYRPSENALDYRPYNDVPGPPIRSRGGRDGRSTLPVNRLAGRQKGQKATRGRGRGRGRGGAS